MGDLPQLHGVIDLSEGQLSSFKRQFLLFDAFRISTLTQSLSKNFEVGQAEKLDLRFLRKKGVVVDLDIDTRIEAHMHSVVDAGMAVHEPVDVGRKTLDESIKAIERLRDRVITAQEARSDYGVRYLASRLTAQELVNGVEVVPICHSPLPPKLISGEEKSEHVINVALEQFPVPDETCSWEELIDFKQELRDKHWTFRRFLSGIGKEAQPVAKVRDDIEYTLSQYQDAMKRRSIKFLHAAVAACVVPTAQVLFDLQGKYAVPVAAALIAFSAIRIELFESERKAEGRACAYIVEAQKRFGKP